MYIKAYVSINKGVIRQMNFPDKKYNIIYADPPWGNEI